MPRLKEKVTDFKQVMPCVTSLRNPSLKARHWDQIERIIGRAIVREKSFTLGNLLEMNVSTYAFEIRYYLVVFRELWFQVTTSVLFIIFLLAQ